jgi:hypothetical protein
VPGGTPWPVPWATGNPPDALAYVFAGELVAGASPRRNGSNNKILWVLRDTTALNFVVDGSPLGQAAPVVSVHGGPSIVDVPSPGCWTFTLHWTVGGAPQTSVVDLEALPNGSLPASEVS